METRVKEHFINIKNRGIEKISSSGTCMERKTLNGSLTSSLKTSITRIKKLRKYPYNKRQRSCYKF